MLGASAVKWDHLAIVHSQLSWKSAEDQISGSIVGSETAVCFISPVGISTLEVNEGPASDRDRV